jgi:PAS domain-containing protein
LPATRDITERRKAHQELLDSERRHPLIEGRRRLCDLPARAGGNVATWNPGAERIKGYASSEIIGSIFNLFYTRKTWNGKWRNRRSPNSPSMAALSGRLANAKGRHVLTEPNMERSNKMIE